MKHKTTSTIFDPAAALAAAPEVPVHDEDNPPTDAADWEHATVTQGGGVAATLTELRRPHGYRKAPFEVSTAVRLSPEVVAFFKAGGTGWQARIDEVLKDYMREHSRQ